MATDAVDRDALDALAEEARRAGEAGEQIRAYILRERPHLLACYDLETLVGLVRQAIERGRAA